MNISELARHLNAPVKELYTILPEFGFDIGHKAIKVDDRVAEQIKKQWRRMKAEWRARQDKAQEDKKRLEKETRQAQGKSARIPAALSVREFADRLELPVTTVIAELMKNGILAAMNERIDAETATVIAEDLGYSVQKEEDSAPAADEHAAESLKQMLEAEAVETLKPRPPVIVVMGHVDHGKTKLLDAIRKTNIIDTEAGGITQHIGAYQTNKNGRALTFIDTPGHEAFTVMRSRGARVADIAILVVAADDGVMPQTIEAIKIIQAAKLPFIVAVNKIDKPEADVNKVMTGLSQHGVQPEEWGGSVPLVSISAKAGTNIDKLLDTLLLVADMEAGRIQANPARPALGTIIESHVDKGEGPVATVLIQGGTLHPGNPLVVNGKIYGTVRAMKNFRGEVVPAAPPAMPVRILGFKVSPEVGDILDVAAVASAEKIRKTKMVTRGAVQPAAKQAEAGAPAQEEDAVKKKFFNIVLRGDVLGSMEAILASLEKFRHDEVGVKVVSKGLGNITESDVSAAGGAGGMVLGFHVVPAPGVEELAREKHVEIKLFKVIYDLINFVRDELEKLLLPEVIVTEFGRVKILAVFRTDKKAMTIGGRVEEGKLVAGAKARVKRAGEIIGKGKFASLQSGKQETREVHAGQECGIRYEGKVGVEVGDVLEAYNEEVRVRKLRI